MINDLKVEELLKSCLIYIYLFFFKRNYLRETKAKAYEQKSFKDQIGLKYTSPKIEPKLLSEEVSKEPTLKMLLGSGLNSGTTLKQKPEAKKNLSLTSFSTKAPPTLSVGSRPQTASKNTETIRAPTIERPKTAATTKSMSLTSQIAFGSSKQLKNQPRRNLSSANSHPK